MEQNDTAEKIIKAFIELFRDYGYKGTTTRAVAEQAGVNEVTIFRHFGNKKGMMEAVLQSVSMSPIVEKVVSEKMIWELEHDLLLIAQEYHKYMEKMKDLVLIGFRDAGLFPELNETIIEIPRQLKKVMVSYFEEMSIRGKIIETDIEFQAMNFIWMNFGYFISESRFGNELISGTQDDFIKNSIQLFTRGLTP